VLEETTLTVEQLMQVRDRGLAEAYVPHDVGTEYITTKLETHGYHIQAHGDDARHADDVYMGDGPDLAVYENEGDEEPIAYIEIKTKEDPEWFGRLNLRHFHEYVNFSNEQDVPVWLWFALVDSDTETIHRTAWLQVQHTDQIDGRVTDATDETMAFYEEDMRSVEDADGLCCIDGSDIVGVRNDEVIVDFLPSIHGNDVVQLNDNHFRSFGHFLYQIQ